MTILLEDFMGLIVAEAKVAKSKIKTFSTYDLSDLIDEGVVVFLELEKRFDPDRATFCTALTTCLRNRFYDLVKHSYKSIDSVGEDFENIVHQGSSDKVVQVVDLEDKLSRLSALETMYVYLCIEPTESMIEELKQYPLRKRAILRRVLKITEDEENQVRCNIQTIIGG
jgi:hypothetical protein